MLSEIILKVEVYQMQHDLGIFRIKLCIHAFYYLLAYYLLRKRITIASF